MTAIDPVCKMNVAESEAGLTSIYHGVKYYFCAASCKREFEEHSEDYV